MNGSKWRASLAVAVAVSCGVFLAVASEALNWSSASVATVGFALAALLGLLGAPLILLPFEAPRQFEIFPAQPSGLEPEVLISLLAKWDRELLLEGKPLSLSALAQAASEAGDVSIDMAYVDLLAKLRLDLLDPEAQSSFEDDNQADDALGIYLEEIDDSPRWVADDFNELPSMSTA